MAKDTSYMTNTDMAKFEKNWQWLIEDQTITEPERLSEAADKLLRGADINEVFQINFGIKVTPLIHALCKDKYDLVKFFLQRGADVNIKTPSGDTALHNSLGCPETVELLLKYGADFNILNKEKKTALYQAATSGLSETVKLLLKAGADVNVISSDGATLLDSLFKVKNKKLGWDYNGSKKARINKEYEDIIKTLLQSKDYSLEISKEEHKNEVVKVLKKYFLPALKNMPVYKSEDIAISTAFNDELRDAVEISRANFKTVAKVVDESISIADINIADIITEYADYIDFCLPDQNPGSDMNHASAAAASSVDVVGASSDFDN